MRREEIAEFTVKSVVAGSILGVIFGAANTYLGLRVGLTVSTAIPISVLSVAFFSMGQFFWGKATLLETNMSQTIGSASSSLASGTIFTIPALFLWGIAPTWLQVSVLGLLAGILGTLAMIPLRRILIVDAHDELPYPEGTACAQVLNANEKGFQQSKWIFIGLAIGFGIKLLLDHFLVAPGELSVALPIVHKAHLTLEISAALIAVGYILGFKSASVMVSGSLISSLVIIPLIAQIGEQLTVPLFPEVKLLISQMSADQIWSRYVRYLGAGAVAAAGISTIFRTMPTMIHSLQRILKEVRSNNKLGFGETPYDRTDRDISGKWIVIGIIAVIVILAVVPGIFGGGMSFFPRLVSAVGAGILGLLFVAVSARIVGLIGVSSNPTSGMTIVSLLGTSAVFALLQWNDIAAKAAVLTVGSVVAIAASIAGDTAQDLKTGFLVKASPDKQQYGQLIGIATACWAIAFTIFVLDKAYGFGGKELPAPQATLMRTVIDGVLSGELPWSLVATGASLGLTAILSGLPGLPFAVGIYLPLATMSPIFLGGLLRKFLSPKEATESDAGILCASGLIAGEGLAGVVIAGVAAFTGQKPSGDPFLTGSQGIFTAVTFLIMILFVIRKAKLSER